MGDNMKEEDRIQQKLENFTKEQLIKVISEASKKNKIIEKDIIKLAKKNKTLFENENNISKYNSLLGEAEVIISDFDELGGGPEENEEIVYNNLSEIVELFKEGKLGDETKKEFIENCFEYYGGNSGFDDLLRDSAFEVCKNKNDWLYVIEKLKKSNSEYDKECIIQVYKDKLNDEGTYLKLRIPKLFYGTDYFDLVEYYDKKGDINKAVEIANEGIEKGHGRIIDLIDYLLKIYTKRKDEKNILKYKALSFKENPSLEKYIDARKSDFKNNKEFSSEIDKITNSLGNSGLKAEIDYYNKDYKSVLNYIKGYVNSYSDYLLKNWAQKLERYLPKDILSIYLEKVNRILVYKIAKEYPQAEYYLRRIEFIYLKIINDASEWNNLLDSLNKKSTKLPSFQKMLRSFDKYNAKT